jgi:hypothetical protein
VYRLARRPTPTSRLGRWHVVVNGVMVAGLVTSACGGDEPAQEVTIGEPPVPSSTVTVGPPDESGITPPAGWPRACDLITEDEVLAVLPQATELNAESSDLPLQISETGLGEIGAPPDMTVPDATCTYSFALPGNPETALGPANEIVLEVRTVGTPRIALVNDTEDAAPGSAEASGCVEVSGPVGFDCRKGGVDFALRGFVSPHGVHFAGDPEDINTHYDDRVLRPLADMVMAKLP